MPRILLIGNYPPPYGGVPTHLHYLAEHLGAIGWEVVVLSGGLPSGKPERPFRGVVVYRPCSRDIYLARFRAGRDAMPPSAQAVDGVKWMFNVPSISETGALKEVYQDDMFRTWRRQTAARGYARFAYEVARRHSVQLVSSYHLLGQGQLGLWLGNALGVPVITTIFGEIYSYLELFRRKVDAVRWVCDGSDALISCSDHCGRSLGLLGLSHHVETVYYGIDTQRFHPVVDPHPARAAMGLKPGRKMVLFVARMERDMGLHLLLDALPRILSDPQADVVIVGQRGALTESALAAADYHQGRVWVRPNVGANLLPHYYAAATLVIAPSINERACLGLAIAEANASGKPVVGCRVGGTPEIIQDGRTGRLIPYPDPTHLADAVRSLLSDDQVQGEMGLTARQHACDLFDKNQTNRKMQTIFEQLLECRERQSVRSTDTASMK